DIMHKSGISLNGDLIDLGTNLGIIEKSGTWLSYQEQKLGQGRERAREFLEANRKTANALEKEIKKAHGMTLAEAPIRENQKTDSPKST
ncbi:MAG: DNA recombination/repair protein RecA, partial [Planctomycetes bacterium]|nr:DNA recombination/repair protein RecA [Planctomycetota bacterium]